MKAYYASFNASTMNMDFNSHNQYFETIIELGMIGFFSLLCCFFLTGLSAWVFYFISFFYSSLQFNVPD